MIRKPIAGSASEDRDRCQPSQPVSHVIVTAEKVERFEREFVSLFVLAKQQGRHFRTVKKNLDADGVKPAMDKAMDKEIVGATFYRRERDSDRTVTFDAAEGSCAA